MIIYYIPLHKRQCLVTTNLPSLLPLSFHEMIFILVIIELLMFLFNLPYIISCQLQPLREISVFIHNKDIIQK